MLAALCYAEMAAMHPVAGGAYSYAYAIFGEVFAWIIGWDLILEYGMGAATAAVGWSFYFQELLKGLNLILPPWAAGPPWLTPAASSTSPPPWWFCLWPCSSCCAPAPMPWWPGAWFF